MTSWDLTSLLLLMLLNIDLSEQGCRDYLKENSMKEFPLLRLVHLAKAKDDNSRDTIICTLKYDCKKHQSQTCHLLSECFSENTSEEDTSGCEEESDQSISLYHLICLIVQILPSEMSSEDLYKGCNYDNVCQLYSDITSHAQTTTRPPSSTASERTSTASSTLSPETTPTAPGTLMQKTTTTAPRTPLPKAPPTASRTPLPKSTTTAPATLLPKATPTAREQKTRTTTAPTALSHTTTTATTKLPSKGDKAPTTGNKIGETNLINLLLMSLTFNFIGPLLVYFFMRWRATNQTPVVHDGPWEEVPHAVPHLQFQNMHNETGAETMQLMQLTETASDITSAADPARDEYTERNGLPS